MELWDAYDKEGNLLGFDLVRGEPLPSGAYHLVCECIVRHKDGSFLLMQRAMEKSTYPGGWEASVGGSALKGESALACIQRELWEETGIACKDFQELGRVCLEDYIVVSFTCEVDCAKDSVRLQAGETMDYQWANPAEFADYVREEQYRYFVERLGRYAGWISNYCKIL